MPCSFSLKERGSVGLPCTPPVSGCRCCKRQGVSSQPEAGGGKVRDKETLLPSPLLSSRERGVQRSCEFQKLSRGQVASSTAVSATEYGMRVHLPV